MVRHMSARSSRRRWMAIRPPPSHAPPIRPCFASTTTRTPANGLNGVQLANPFPDRRRAGADRPDNDPFDDDRGDPAGNQHRPVVRAQQPVHGRHQFRLRRHPLRGQRGIGHDRFKLRRQRQRHISRAIRQSDFDRSGLASRHQPIHRPLCARHVRRDRRVFNHGRRPVQLCKHRASGSDRHRSQRQSYVQPLQSDDRRHLQDHAGA